MQEFTFTMDLRCGCCFYTLLDPLLQRARTLQHLDRFDHYPERDNEDSAPALSVPLCKISIDHFSRDPSTDPSRDQLRYKRLWAIRCTEINLKIQFTRSRFSFFWWSEPYHPEAIDCFLFAHAYTVISIYLTNNVEMKMQILSCHSCTRMNIEYLFVT